MYRRIKQFFQRDLWEIDLRRAEGWRGVGLATLRVSVHALRTFLSDLGSLRAAGLSLVTLLALVPLLALVTGIAKGLGYADVLDEKLVELTSQLGEAVQPAVNQVRSLVDRTSFGALGVIGSAALAYSGLLLFIRVEQALNRVWRVKQGRSWYRRLTDFIGLIVLVPLLLLSSLSLSSLLHGARWLRDVPWLNDLYHAGLGVVPHVLVWIAFAALYKMMPSSRVKWSAAAIAGVVAGSSWMFIHGLYLSTQMSVARLNAIYATMAALPLLIVYVQVTWTIFLVGAEVSYAVQNRHQIRGPHALPPATEAVRQRVALHMVDRVCRHFDTGEGQVELSDLATDCGVPAEWVSRVYEDLHAAGILGHIADAPELIVPLRAPGRIRVAEVVEAVHGGVPGPVMNRLRLSPHLEDQLGRIDRATRDILSDDHLDMGLV